MWLSRQEGGRLLPPTVSTLLLSNSIMRRPCPQFSYLQKRNGRGRSLVCLRRFAIVLQDGVGATSAKAQTPPAPIWILSEQVWAPPAGKQLQGKIKAQSSGLPSRGDKGKAAGATPRRRCCCCAGLPRPGNGTRSSGDRTPELPAFSGFSRCQKYRRALADCSAPPI